MRNVVCLSLLFWAVAIARAQCLIHYPEAASYQGTPGYYGPAPSPNNEHDYIFRVGMRSALSGLDRSYIHPQYGYLAGSGMWSEWYDQSGLGSREPAMRGIFNMLALFHVRAHFFQFSMLYLQPKQYKDNPRKVELEADLIGAYAYGALHHADRYKLNLMIDGRPLEVDPNLNLRELSFYYGKFPDFMNTEYHSNAETRLQIIELGWRAGLEGRFGPNLENFKLGYPGYLWMKEVVEQHLKS